MFQNVRDFIPAMCFKHMAGYSLKAVMNYTKKELAILLNSMEQAVAGLQPPMTELIIRDYGKDPYLILISCLLSLRSRDPVTYAVSQELFKHATTPQDMVKMPLAKLEKILHPIGFFKRKAAIVKAVSHDLIQRFDGKVPKTEADLRSIKNVGPKTANLVLSKAFDKQALVVDTHVHRIANHLGLVHTKTPQQTEKALKKIFSPAQWKRVTYLFIMWGQNICKPAAKRCRCKDLMSPD